MFTILASVPDWVQNIIGKIDVASLFSIVSSLFAGGFAVWGVKIYKAFQTFKQKTPAELIAMSMDKIEPTLEKYIAEVKDYVDTISTNLQVYNQNLLLLASKLGVDSETIKTLLDNSKNYIDSDTTKKVEETIETKQEEEKTEAIAKEETDKELDNIIEGM